MFDVNDFFDGSMMDAPGIRKIDAINTFYRRLSVTFIGFRGQGPRPKDF